MKSLFLKAGKLLLSIIPVRIISVFHYYLGRALFYKNGAIEKEVTDYYAVSSMFMLHSLVGQLGSLKGERLLSVGCRISHLMDYAAIFKGVFHSTMIEAEEVPEFVGVDFTQRVGDFFLLERRDVGEFDVVMSHVTVQCMADARYGNEVSSDPWGGINRPYNFSKKLKSLVTSKPGRAIKVLVSIAVNVDGFLGANQGVLGHQRFIDSFERDGFVLKTCLFDKKCGGLKLNSYSGPRLTTELPLAHLADNFYVVGNYYFEST